MPRGRGAARERRRTPRRIHIGEALKLHFSQSARSHFRIRARAAKSLISTNRNAVCAALLIAAGAALRLHAPGGFVPGLNKDEASGAYDVWALLHYGIDRNGDSWPAHFVAWGDGLNALYPYIAMPFIWVAGLDAAAYRLPMALAGIVSLWLMWRVAHNAAGPKFALLALLFLAVNPWHIKASRSALESNILPFVILLGVYFLSRHDRGRFGVQAAAAAAIALSAYAYGTAYAFAPLFLAAALGWLALNRALTPRRAVALSAIAAAVAAPIIAFLVVNALDLDSIRVLGATIPRYTAAAARYESVGLAFGWDWARAADSLRELGHLLLGYSDSRGRSVFPAFSLLPPFSIVIAAAGLWAALRRARAGGDFGVHLLAALWFAAAMAIAVMTDVNSVRINLVWLPAIYLTALGAAALWGAGARRRAAFCAVAAAVVGLSGAAVYQHFSAQRALAAMPYFIGLEAAADRAVESAGENDLIYVSEDVFIPYIHTLLYTAASPYRYLETRVVDNPNEETQRILAFDRFVFLSPFRRDAPRRNAQSAENSARRYRHLETAGVDIDGIDHYIFRISRESDGIGALDADEFALERHGAFIYAYRRDAAPGEGGGQDEGGGAIRPDAPLVRGEPAARAKFDLRVQDGEIIYFKQPCSPYDTLDRFFLHIVPKNAHDLPEDRRQHGFDNLDFWFWQHGAMYGHRCMASVPLPDYAVAAIETGQTERTRDWPRFWRQSWKRLWQAELKF